MKKLKSSISSFIILYTVYNFFTILFLSLIYFLFFDFSSFNSVLAYFQLPIIFSIAYQLTRDPDKWLEMMKVRALIEENYDTRGWAQRGSSNFEGFSEVEILKHKIQVNEHSRKIELEKQKKRLLKFEQKRIQNEINTNYKKTGIRETNEQKILREAKEKKEIEQKKQLQEEMEKNFIESGIRETDSNKQLRLEQETKNLKRYHFFEDFKRKYNNTEKTIYFCNSCGLALNLDGQCSCA